MYVILLDDVQQRIRLKFMAAIHAQLAGQQDVEVPDLDEERAEWEKWLRSDPPKIADRRSRDEEVLYQALFPDDRPGSKVDFMRRQQIESLHEMGMHVAVPEVEEV